MSIETLEAKVKAYAEAVGKDVEHVYDELKAFIGAKHAEAAKPSAATGPANTDAAAPQTGNIMPPPKS